MNPPRPQQHLGLELLALWQQFTWRHWVQAPISTAILAGILSLGVGVFFSIRLANRAAVSGFSLFTESLNGESDLVITPPARKLSVRALGEIRRELGDLPVSLFPVLETTATRPDPRGDGFNAEQFHLVGVDLLALPNLIFLNPPSYRPPVDFSEGDQETPSSWRLETGEGPQVFVTEAGSREHGLKTGDFFSLVLGSRETRFEVVGIIPEDKFTAGKPAELLVMDLPQLQLLTQQTTYIDRIECRIPMGPNYSRWLKEATQKLQSADSPLWEVDLPERQRQTGAVMTRAFRLNLTILSGLALMVGIYLVLQALEAAVIKRRTEIATLRSLGVSPKAIKAAWLIESACLGTIGSLAGLALGFGGAQLAVGAIAQTVNSLYYSNTTTAAGWDTGEACFAFSIGVIASLIAAWLPAREAASTPPAQVLARGNTSDGLHFLSHPRKGIVALILACLACALPPISLGPGVNFPGGGYVAALALVIGTTILSGLGFRPLAKGLLRIFHDSAWVGYAMSHLRRPSGRHRLTAAGLVVAIGMAAGMSLLISSFERTMTSWIQQALKADLYIATKGVGNISSDNRIDAETWQDLVQQPEVQEAEVGQMFPIRFRDADTYLVGASFGRKAGWRHMVWIEEPDTPFGEMNHERPVSPGVINESFQQRFNVQSGDTLHVPTPQGPQQVRVAGIFADYGNERGAIVISRDLVTEWFRDDRALNVALHLFPDTDPDKVRNRLTTKHPGLVVRTNRHLRAEVMEVFHETFSVTHALKWIGVTVALIGLALGLWSILLERRGELRILKEMGLNRLGIALATTAEGLGISLVGLLAGSLLSIALGWVLIYVINYQSFGWTLAFKIPWADLVYLSLGIMAIGAVVSFLVGYRGAQLPSDQEE